MKNLVLIIAASLVSFASFAQGNVFDDYVDTDHKGMGIVAYNKAVYNSYVDGKVTYHFWGDYTHKGMKIIIEEANRILKEFESDIFVSKDRFLNHKGYFYIGEGERVDKYNLPDGGVLHIGFLDTGIKIDDTNVKSFEMWVKYPNK